MSGKVMIRVFADYPRQMENVNPLDRLNGGHSGAVKRICDKYGLRFKIVGAHTYSYGDMYIIASSKDYSTLGAALVEVMALDLSITL